LIKEGDDSMELEQLENDLVSDDDTIKDKYLTFIIDGEDFGIDIAHVIEIISVSAITKLPSMEDYIKGVINLRGSIIPVIDVRLKFRKEERPYDEFTCIIVVEYNDYTVGLIVDTVHEVLTIPESAISSPPNAKLKYQNKFIKNIGKIGDKVQLLLDVDKFLFLN
jgi:purine-binding chemotaxis protein CheW